MKTLKAQVLMFASVTLSFLAAKEKRDTACVITRAERTAASRKQSVSSMTLEAASVMDGPGESVSQCVVHCGRQGTNWLKTHILVQFLVVSDAQSHLVLLFCMTDVYLLFNTHVYVLLTTTETSYLTLMSTYYLLLSTYYYWNSVSQSTFPGCRLHLR